MRALRMVVVSVLALGGLAACGGDDDGGDDRTSLEDAEVPAPGEATGTVTILTTAELEALATLVGDAFEAENEAATVEIALTTSDELGEDTEDGAGEVVVAPSNWISDQLDEADFPATQFARTLAVIVTPTGNPEGISDVTAFDRASSLRTRICGPDSQFGNFSEIVVNNGGVTPAPGAVGEGCDQEAIDQVAAGELDAAVVYRSEVGTRTDVDLVEIPDDINVVIDVAYVVADATPVAAGLAQFLDSAEAEAILTENRLLP